jgi:hypothetical protein
MEWGGGEQRDVIIPGVHNSFTELLMCGLRKLNFNAVNVYR